MELLTRNADALSLMRSSIVKNFRVERTLGRHLQARIALVAINANQCRTMLSLKVSQEHCVKLQVTANMATATGIVVHISGAVAKDFAWLADAFPPILAGIIQDMSVKFDNRQNLRTGIALLRTLLRKAGAAIRTVASKGSPIVDASVASCA